MDYLKILTTTSQNLRTLADYIEQDVPEQMINMEYFWSLYKTPTEVAATKDIHECGASACALGWSASCPNPSLTVTKFDYLKTGDIDWFRYTLRVYPALGHPHYEEWDAVFGHELSSCKEEVCLRLRQKAEHLDSVFDTISSINESEGIY